MVGFPRVCYLTIFHMEVNMALYLVQHGKSLPKDMDPERGLSQLGMEETNRIAPVARGYGIGVRRVVHSGKKRARQTAEIYHEALGVETPLEQIDNIGPLDDVKSFRDTVTVEEGCMVVGHLPFMQRLLSILTVGDESVEFYRFQNSGIVCLDGEKDEDGRVNWFIKWTLNPCID